MKFEWEKFDIQKLNDTKFGVSETPKPSLDPPSKNRVMLTNIDFIFSGEPKILTNYNNALLRLIDNKTMQKYEWESLLHNESLASTLNSPMGLKQLQNEWQMLSSTLKENTILKRLMNSINLIQDKLGFDPNSTADDK